MLRLAAALLALVTGLALSSPGARAQDVTVTGLTYNMGFLTLTIPRMTVRGTRLTESDLRTILAPEIGPDLEGRLKRLDAASVLIPEMILEQKVAQATQRIVYRNVSMERIEAGLIGTMSVPETIGELRDPKDGTTGFRIGRTEASRIDLPWSARVLATAEPNPDSQPMRPLYESFSYRDYVMEMPGNEGRITVGRVSLRDSKARPGKQPLIEDIRKLLVSLEEAERAGRGSNSNSPSPAELAMIGRLFQFSENFEYGVMDLEAMRGEMRVEGETGAFAIGAMRFSDQAQNNGLAMSNLSMAIAGTSMELAEFAIRDFGFAGSFREIGQLLERGDLSAFITGWPKLIPKLGTIRMAGFNATIPPESSERPAQRRDGGRQVRPSEPTRISLKAGELSFGNQLNGIPTALRLNIEDMAAPLPARSREQGVRDLRAMGFNDINLSGLVDLAWQERSNQFDIRSISSAIRGLASVGIAAQLGNVTRDAFSTDQAVAQVSWLGATAQRLQFRLQNDGGIEKFIENEARKQRKTAEALRREWGTAAAVGIPAMLGDSDSVKSLANAVSRFIARPGSLSINVSSRQPAGLGVADAMAAMNNPRGLLDKITIDARAE